MAHPSIFRLAMFLVPAAALLVGCGTSMEPPQAVAEPKVVTTFKPVLPSDTQSEREKLLQQQLELQREKAELEKKKLEHDLVFERQKNELEREKRVRVDEEYAKARRAEQATKYSDAEYATVRLAISEHGDSFGESLLARTHPTGTYLSTDTPLVSISSAKDVVTANVTVRWKGAFTENSYVTTYSFRVTKQGLDRLEVLRDSSVIKIDPHLLRTAELDLRTAFGS